LRKPALGHDPIDILRVFRQQLGDGGALVLAEREDDGVGRG
jgi:hypothetical protein